MDSCSELPGAARFPLCEWIQGAGLGFWALSACRALGVSRLLCNMSAPPDTTHPLRWKGELTGFTWVWILEPESRQGWKVNNQSRNTLRNDFWGLTWEDHRVRDLVLGSSRYTAQYRRSNGVLPYTGWMGWYKERAWNARIEDEILILLLPWKTNFSKLDKQIFPKSFLFIGFLQGFHEMVAMKAS